MKGLNQYQTFSYMLFSWGFWSIAFTLLDLSAGCRFTKPWAQFLHGGLIALAIVERSWAILKASEGINFIRTGFLRSDISFRYFSRAFSFDGVGYCWGRARDTSTLREVYWHGHSCWLLQWWNWVEIHQEASMTSGTPPAKHVALDGFGIV